MNKRIRINGNLYEAVSPSFNSKPDSREELADSIDALVSVLRIYWSSFLVCSEVKWWLK